MRAGDETEFFQVRHDVADAGRAQFEPGKPGERTRTDRLAVGNVALDQHLQKPLRPLAGKRIACGHGSILSCPTPDLSVADGSRIGKCALIRSMSKTFKT